MLNNSYTADNCQLFEMFEMFELFKLFNVRNISNFLNSKNISNNFYGYIVGNCQGWR